MCGLVGFVGRGDWEDLGAMMNSLAHRGPDGAGSYVDENSQVYLGHCRLAIIDVAGGVQPMWNREGTIGVVFNGEIYNHLDLRRELQALGHVFATDHSDTEVLIHGYAAWGKELVEKLNGMFAFAIYDRRCRRIFLARDRFGEKPLYYAQKGDLFAFASELRAIAAHRSFDARLNRRSLQKFFAYGFLPAPNAILENCQKLPGGHWLTFDLDTGRVDTYRYWQFTVEPDSAFDSRREDDVVDELRALLFDAVARRSISDVPIGLFLSGGLDSSAVLAGAVRHLGAEAVRTFTIGFSEASFDESGPAAAVAKHFGVHNAMERLDLDAARDLIPAVLSRLDEPLGDGSVLPTYLLSAFTRKHVTVALSGDGGDELFAGYDPFVALPWARLYDACVPRPLHRFLRGAFAHMPVSTRNMALDFKLKRTLGGLSYSPDVRTPVWMSAADPAMIADLMEEPLTKEELYEEAIQLWSESGAKSDLEKTLEYFTNYYLQDDILFKVDRAAMMTSLESRAVFLDNDLVDFCRRLPTHFKFRRGERKYILRRAMRGIVPDDILDRPKKGFGMPLTKWLRQTPAEPPLTSVSGVRMERIARAWAEHRGGTSDHRLLLWSWLSLQNLPYDFRATTQRMVA